MFNTLNYKNIFAKRNNNNHANVEYGDSKTALLEIEVSLYLLILEKNMTFQTVFSGKYSIIKESIWKNFHRLTKIILKMFFIFNCFIQ